MYTNTHIFMLVHRHSHFNHGCFCRVVMEFPSRFLSAEEDPVKVVFQNILCSLQALDQLKYNPREKAGQVNVNKVTHEAMIAFYNTQVTVEEEHILHITVSITSISCFAGTHQPKNQHIVHTCSQPPDCIVEQQIPQTWMKLWWVQFIGQHIAPWHHNMTAHSVTQQISERRALIEGHYQDVHEDMAQLVHILADYQ